MIYIRFYLLLYRFKFSIFCSFIVHRCTPLPKGLVFPLTTAAAAIQSVIFLHPHPNPNPHPKSFSPWKITVLRMWIWMWMRMCVIIAFLFGKSKLIGISYSLVYISMSLSLPVTHFNCVFYTGTSYNNHNNNNNNLHPKLCISTRKQYKRFILFNRFGSIV